MISNPSLMSHESPREYEQLVSGLMAAHEPRDGFERLVIQHLADASWELRRVRATDSEYWEHVGGCYNRGNTGVAEALLQEKETRFRALFKMRAHAQRQYEKAMNDLYRMLDLRDRKAKGQTPNSLFLSYQFWASTLLLSRLHPNDTRSLHSRSI